MEHPSGHWGLRGVQADQGQVLEKGFWLIHSSLDSSPLMLCIVSTRMISLLDDFFWNLSETNICKVHRC